MSSKKRILVVDDSSIIRSILRRVFEDMDFEVDGAETFEGGLEVLEERHGADLLLLDVNLPDANGAEACGLIKAYPAYRGLPIVFISSSNEDYLREKVAETGAYGYIRKPISPSSVLRWIRANATALFGGPLEDEMPLPASEGLRSPPTIVQAPVVLARADVLPRAVARSVPRGPRHVLLVDDSRFLRAILGDTLERIGLRVTAFESITAMGDFLTHESVDLAFLDIHMPDITGDRACQLFKARPETSFPVVLISSEDEERIRARVDACGADAYLRKPFTPINVIEWMKARSAQFFGEALDAPSPAASADEGLPQIEELVLEDPDRLRQVEILMGQLTSAIPSVRLDACYSLGECKAVEAVGALIELLYGEEDLLKAEAAWALGEIGDGAAVEPLMTLLMMKHPTVRERVVEALGKIGDERAIDPLLHVLRSGDRDLCILAIKALGHLGGDRSVGALEEVCAEVVDDEILANAHWALRVIDGADR